jgi:hypothetical protein
VADNFHLGKRRRRQNRFEEPEDPRHKRGNIHKELACLASCIRSELHWNRKSMPGHTHEELGIVVLEYGRNCRGGSFRVCRTTAEADTLVVCYVSPKSVNRMYAAFITYRALESFGRRSRNLYV